MITGWCKLIRMKTVATISPDNATEIKIKLKFKRNLEMNNTKKTLNKKMSILAGAVLAASSSQAAFDEGNAVLFAYASDDATYFVDLGVTGQDLANSASVDISDAGLGAFLTSNPSAQWTVVASINDTTRVAGPPAAGASLANSGVVGTSLSGSAVGTTGSSNDTQRATLNDWLSNVQAAAGGSNSFGVEGTDPVSANAPRNGGFFNDSLIAVGSASALFYSQANPASGATLADANVVNLVGGTFNYQAELSSDGTFTANAVPVPAAAWLFGSALAGLGVVRRKK